MPYRARLLPPLIAVLGLGVLVEVVRSLVATPAPADYAVYFGVQLLAAGLVWARVAAERRNRRAWLLMATYLTLWLAGNVGWAISYEGVADPPFPNWTDGAFIASYLFAYPGIAMLLRDGRRRVRASRWLDGFVVGLTLSALCTALFLGPVIASAHGSLLSYAARLAYPAFDVLLLCLVGLAFGLRNWRPGRMWAWLGSFAVLTAFSDAVYGYEHAVGTYSTSSFVNLTWLLAMTALAPAAWSAPARSAPARDDDEPEATIPTAFAVAALVLLVVAQAQPVTPAAIVLAVAALVVGGVRAYLASRENVRLLRRSRHEALTDGLTGLGNRRRLMHDLDDALTAAAEGRRATLVFFDLDGFKGYNDAFGHAAGDALLVRLAGALSGAVSGAGRAYRLGGDEFCVLLRHDAGAGDPTVACAGAALSEHGEGFAIGASYGLVRLPADADSAAVALQLADERMYDQKDSRRGSPRRQARDLLLQVLREREPDLEEHVDDVRALALAVGRRLGLGADELDEIGRGAELHDIGKVAVPDAILRKPGPLDDGEWDLMRQHTIVGERILAAAPALRGVGRLVRSSHERWDGGGYPDGLVGGEIPLGARIIAVCDAFDAMRQERPYAPSMPEADAVAELRRCAGSQFDPRVVDALAAVLAEGAGRGLRVAAA